MSKSPRFIPTGVGNTARVHLSKNETKVHPHGCGEYTANSQLLAPREGSSPRVWGIRWWIRRWVTNGRFIPTGVGNTARQGRGGISRKVHPHGCGEYYLPFSGSSGDHGSSPRVWGIRRKTKTRRIITRFIPTGVGNTPGRITIQRQIEVHPHGCGEYGEPKTPRSTKAGSSPRVWGILSSALPQLIPARFIPTGVGNTSQLQSRNSFVRVHPHGCGEYVFLAKLPTEFAGSSPRVWGIRVCRNSRRGCIRFIPTGVGNTPICFYVTRYM